LIRLYETRENLKQNSKIELARGEISVTETLNPENGSFCQNGTGRPGKNYVSFSNEGRGGEGPPAVNTC